MNLFDITCPKCEAAPQIACAYTKTHVDRIRKAKDWRSATLGDKWWESKPASLAPLSEAIRNFRN